jgi:hypothetical protein
LNSALEAMNHELRLAGHGAAVVQAPTLFRPVLLSLFLCFRQISFQPSISNPSAQIERYPFVADFADTPLQLLLIQPAVQSAFTDFVFSF